MRKGFSLLMCAPNERRIVQGLLKGLGRGEFAAPSGFTTGDTCSMAEESDISEMSIDLDILDKLKARVQLARKIDTAQHKVKKREHDRKWMRETAEALEIELDSDIARCELNQPSYWCRDC